MGRNNKSNRMLVRRWEMERAFVKPFRSFDECSKLLFLFITSSDKLSRKNILTSDAYFERFTNDLEFQKDPLFEPRVVQLSDALRHAKDRLANRKSRQELLQEKATRRAEKAEKKAAKGQPPSPPQPAGDPSEIWAQAIAKKEKP